MCGGARYATPLMLFVSDANPANETVGLVFR
jgi:hypothetical protein